MYLYLDLLVGSFTFTHSHGVFYDTIPDSKVHGANMVTTWVLSAPDGPYVGPMNIAIRDVVGGRSVYLTPRT